MMFNISPREIEVAKLLCLPDSKIAEKLNITVSTVQTHRLHLREKTGRVSRPSVLIELIRAGIIDINEVETE